MRIGALLAGVGVLAGAFGGHGLEGVVTPDRLETWETAVRYHMIHAVALVFVGLLAERGGGGLVERSGLLLLAGLIVFSGTLYLLVLTDTAWLGAITPVGGLLMIAGWFTLAFAIGRPHRRGDASQ